MWDQFWLSVNRWHSPYEYAVDTDGVEWRADPRRPDAAPVKTYDPNFVQDRVPTSAGLDYALATVAALIVLLLGALLGSVV